MRYTLLHDIPGRLRVVCGPGPRLAPVDAYAIQALLATQEGIRSVRVSARTGSMLILYDRHLSRRQVLAMLTVLAPEDWDGFGANYKPRPSLMSLTVSALVKSGLKILFRRLFLPLPIRFAWTFCNALPHLAKGMRSLARGRLNLAVLDACALGIMLLRRDFYTLRTVLLLFDAADALEGWTREESRHNLADSLALKIDTVWIKAGNGAETAARLADVRPGDRVVVRTGSTIPVDGVVAEGEALVNESLLTGESASLHKRPGIAVFAGTVLEEGMLVIRTERIAAETRLQDIIRFIEESEALKAGVQSRAERLADAMVPYSLLLALVVYIVTRNPLRAAAALMVDYSCAIRMSTPLAILSAISEGVRRGVLIKGGKYLEELALADCLVLDKTGTLTMARPRVAAVIPFGGRDAREVLRLAACIEEHFPHPVAKAVVRQAEREGLQHREQHAEPEYILAHGIVSKLHGRQVLIGSAHFVFDDRRIPATPEVLAAADVEAARGRSLLYLAIGGEVAGIIAIEDPIRPDAAATLDGMARNGVRHIAMLTGDGARTARNVAGSLGLDSFTANLLPVDKARLIKGFRRAGYRVMFVGDGVNDSPALSAANVGVSLKDGADIAREVAGVVLMDGRLGGLMVSRMLAAQTLSRVNRQFGFIMASNSLLMALGLAGTLSPRLAALLHNLVTVAVTANSVRRLLPEDGGGDEGGAVKGLAAPAPLPAEAPAAALDSATA